MLTFDPLQNILTVDPYLVGYLLTARDYISQLVQWGDILDCVPSNNKIGMNSILVTLGNSLMKVLFAPQIPSATHHRHTHSIPTNC